MSLIDLDEAVAAVEGLLSARHERWSESDSDLEYEGALEEALDALRSLATVEAPPAPSAPALAPGVCGIRFRSKHNEPAVCEREPGHLGRHAGRHECGWGAPLLDPRPPADVDPAKVCVVCDDNSGCCVCPWGSKG